MRHTQPQGRVAPTHALHGTNLEMDPTVGLLSLLPPTVRSLGPLFLAGSVTNIVVWMKSPTPAKDMPNGRLVNLVLVLCCQNFCVRTLVCHSEERRSLIFERLWCPFLITGIAMLMRRKKVVKYQRFMQKWKLIPT